MIVAACEIVSHCGFNGMFRRSMDIQNHSDAETSAIAKVMINEEMNSMR